MSNKKIKKDSNNNLERYNDKFPQQENNIQPNNSVDNNTDQYACLTCEKSYKSYAALYKHKQVKHKNGKCEIKCPHNKGQGRTGRPIKIQKNTINEEQKSQDLVLNLNENDILLDQDHVETLDQLLFFLTTMKIKVIKKDNSEQINQQAIIIAINQLPQNLIKDSQSLLIQIEYFLNQSDEQMLQFDTEEQTNDHTCNQIFAIFVRNLSSFIEPEYVKEICYFICCYQIAMNQQGWQILQEEEMQDQENDDENNQNSQLQQNNHKNQQNMPEFCSTKNIEIAICISNDFIEQLSEKLFFDDYKCTDKKFKLFNHKSDRQTFLKNIEQLTKQFCNWLLLKKYTYSYLESNIN